MADRTEERHTLTAPFTPPSRGEGFAAALTAAVKEMNDRFGEPEETEEEEG